MTGFLTCLFILFHSGFSYGGEVSDVVKSDLYGISRPQYNGYDIGAFEYVAQAPDNFKIVSISENAGKLNITISWDSSPQARSYVVYWGNATGNYNIGTSASLSAMTTSYTLSPAPAAGIVYYIVVKAFDSKGRSSEYSEEVQNGPKITSFTVNGLAGGDIEYTNSRQIAAELDTSNYGTITEYALALTDTPDPPGAFLTITGPLPLNVDFTLGDDDKNWTVYAWVKDNLGNVSAKAAKTNIILDRIVPDAPASMALNAADYTSEYNGVFYTHQSANLTVSGNGEDAAAVEFFDYGAAIAGATVTVSGGAFSIDLNLAEGAHEITATQTDRAGNVSMATGALNITVDNILPTVALSYSGVQPYSGADNITVTATFTDASAIIDPKIRIDYSGTANDVPATAMVATANNKVWTYFMNVPSGNSGPANITITATDGAGNPIGAHTNQVFMVDNKAPTVAITYSLPDPYYDSDVVTVTATFDDSNGIRDSPPPAIAIDYAGVDSDVAATAMTATVNNKVWTYSMDVPAGNDGLATITITGTDKAGNPIGAHSGNTFTVDNDTPYAPPEMYNFPAEIPVVEAGTTSQGFLVTEGDGTYIWSATAPDGSNASARLSATVGNNVTFSAPTSGNFAGVYTVKVKDGRSSSTSFEIKVPIRIAPASKTFTSIDPSTGAPNDQTFAVSGTGGTYTWEVLESAEAPAEVPDPESYGSWQSLTVLRPAAVAVSRTFYLRATVIGDANLTAANGLNQKVGGPYTIAPVGTFTVTVKDQTGAPVAGAVVAVDYSGAAAQTTGAGGTAVFYLPDTGGTYTYTVTAANYVGAVSASSQKTVSVTLAPGGETVSGTVEDENGDPVAGATVTVYQPDDPDVQSQAVTDASGTFTIWLPLNAPATGWTVAAVKDGYGASQIENPQDLSNLSFGGAGTPLAAKTNITISAVGLGSGIRLDIGAAPAFSENGQMQITKTFGSGSLGPLTYNSASYTYSVYYDIREDFAVRITDLRNDAKYDFAYDLGSTASSHPQSSMDIDAGGGIQTLAANGQTAKVQVPAGGVTIDCKIIIQQVGKSSASAAPVSASPGFLYNVTAINPATGQALSTSQLKKIFITLPIDLGVVLPGQLESGAVKIFQADSLEHLEAGLGTVVPTSRITATDYLGDGATGSVTFWVDHLSVFGLGTEVPQITNRPDNDALLSGQVYDRFMMTGAIGAISWSATAGSIDANGRFTAPQVTVGAQQVDITATDTGAGGTSVTATVTVYPTFAVTNYPAATPVVESGTTSQAFSVTGGDGTYAWSVAAPDGSDATDRLSAATGSSVTFSAPDSGNFAGVYRATVADGKGFTTSFDIDVPIGIAPASKTFTAKNIANGAPNDQSFAVSGTQGTYQLEILETAASAAAVGDPESYGTWQSPDLFRPADGTTPKTFYLRATVLGDANLTAANGLNQKVTGPYTIVPVVFYTVTVTDATGVGITGAEVIVAYNEPVTGSPVATLTTDGQGQAMFSLPDADGTYLYAVTAAGNVSRVVSSAEQSVTVALAEGGETISGRVEDADGNPVVGATITAFQSDNPDLGYFTFSLGDDPAPPEDETGTFVLWLPVGAPLSGWTVTAGKFGYGASQIEDPLDLVNVSFSGAGNRLTAKTDITVITTAGGSGILLEIGAAPGFTADGQLSIALAAGGGSLGALTYNGAAQTYAVTYDTVADFDAQITDLRNGARTDYTYEHGATATGRAQSRIDVAGGGGTQILAANGQTATVYVPPGGVAATARIVIQQIAKPGSSSGAPASGSPVYVYDVAALDPATGLALDASLIKKIVITLPIDLSRVLPGQLESGAVKIFQAETFELLDAGQGALVPASQIVGSDYVGDGAIGSVTFWVEHLSVFGIGTEPAEPVVPGGGGGGGGGGCFITTAVEEAPGDLFTRILKPLRDGWMGLVGRRLTE